MDGSALTADYAAVDWAATSLGPPEDWSQALRTSLSICTSSRFPILLWWGPDLSMLYNTAYLPILGDKHPASLAAPGEQVWPEIWDVIGPMLRDVLAGRGATYSQDQLLVLDRRGFLEECYFTFSYSPVLDDEPAGDAAPGVAGVFTAVTETTAQVLGRRRLEALSGLAEVLATARTEDDVLAVATAHLALTPDTPCVAVVGPDGAVVAAAGDDVDGDGGLDADEAAVRRVEAPFGAGSGLVLRVRVSPRLVVDRDLVDHVQAAARQVAAALAVVAEREAQRRRAAALAELDAAKTAFFANISHELRTPLTLLAGPIDDLLAAGDGDPARRAHLLRLADRNARRLRTLVDDLLDFTRLQAGRLEPQREPVDLGALTAQVAEEFRPAVEGAGLALEVLVPAGAARTSVDPRMWERILDNLVSNAFKHTFAGSIAVRLRVEGDDAVLEVEDTGVGIATSEQARVFERFHRVPDAPARTSEGSGIGLAFVRELVVLHGGDVELESTPGRGSRFVVRLPVTSPGGVAAASPLASPLASSVGSSMLQATREEAERWAAADSPHEEPAGAGQGVRPRVLVVDDNDDMRRYVADVLRDLADVSLAANGGDALAAEAAARTAGQPFGLVVADVMMPVLDGLGLVRRLKGDPATAGLPVLLLSARAGDEAALGGLEAGADDYIAKPFTARELRARVQSQLRLAAARAEQVSAERAVAEDLQRALLPVVPPSAPGLLFAARYRSGTATTSVGGDFYDALPLDSSRTAFVVGDVVGRGAGAAAVLGQVRAAWRAEALRPADGVRGPGEVLAALDAVVDSLDVPLVTALCGVYDATSGQLVVASAGHPPPVVTSSLGARWVDVEPGAPLGVPGAGVWPVASVVLHVDDVVLLYTDGLVEVRGSDLGTGMDALRAAAGSPPASLEAFCDGLLATLRPGTEQDDDIALLAMRAVSPSGGGHHVTRLDLDSTVAAPQVARRRVREVLDVLDLTALEGPATLLTSELVTNAVVHAGGPVELVIAARPNLLHVAVSDHDRGLPVADGSDLDSEHGRGLLIVDTLASRWGSDRFPDGKRVWFELDH